MAIEQPQSTDLLNNPSHSKMHRVIAIDSGATDEAFYIDSSSDGQFANNVNIASGKQYKIDNVALSANDVGAAPAPSQSFISGEAFSRSFVITNPTAAKYFKGWRCPVTATITAVHLNCSGNVVVGQLWQYDSNGLNGAAVDSSDITGVVDTNVDDDGTLSAPNITAGNYVGWHTTSVTSTPTYAYITFEGYYN